MPVWASIGTPPGGITADVVWLTPSRTWPNSARKKFRTRSFSITRNTAATGPAAFIAPPARRAARLRRRGAVPPATPLAMQIHTGEMNYDEAQPKIPAPPFPQTP